MSVVRPPNSDCDFDAVTRRLRTAGCVFAENEAAILCEAAIDEQQLEIFIRRREAGEPLETIVGWVVFGSLRLSVGPGVFVPRQRTLLLAHAAVATARRQPSPVLLEAFAGVAPVAATVLSAVPKAEVHVSDIDPVALAHAQRNAPGAARFHCGDGLEALPGHLRGRITTLAAVPPYVPSSAAEFLPREAREYEPANTLFAGDDGLDHVRRLISEARPWLAPESTMLIEMNVSQHAAAAEYARDQGYVASRPSGAAPRTTDGQTALLALRLD